jgi:dihydropteroate synthase
MSSVATGWQCKGRLLDLSRPVVMGVLNVTPDSFSDGGRFIRRDAALAHARAMLAEGAAILDVGGESTRPGAAPPSLQEEIDRVVPVIEAVRGESAAYISIDTSRPEVMRAAVAAGADIINDVRALRVDGALETVAASGAGVCLMHMQGEPDTMQAAPAYENATTEVFGFLKQRIDACGAAGIATPRIAIDPGFGFGKRTRDNLRLLRELQRFEQLGCALLVGLSRKSMLARLTGREVDHRLAGSVALATIAVLHGARIVRAHDVAATVDAVRVAHAVRLGEGFDGT